MPGIALLNCGIAAFGFVLLYKIMPETENRTLEDIEMHFSDNSKKLTDRKIAKQDETEKNESIDGITRNEIGNEEAVNGIENRAFSIDV